jgi:hypothetical protein
MLFCLMAVQITLRPTMHKSSHFSLYSTIFVIWLVDNNHSDRCKMTCHYRLYLTHV